MTNQDQEVGAAKSKLSEPAAPPTAPTQSDAELPPVKVTAMQVVGVVLVGGVLGGATMSVFFLLVLLCAILVLFDASAAGMQRVPDRKGLLNMNPVSWGVVTALLFVLGWPLYLVARFKAGPQKGNIALLIGVVLTGTLVVGGVGLTLARRFLNKPVAAAVQCKGGAKGLQCEVKQTTGTQNASVCWQVRLDCTNGKPALANGCADIAPDKPTAHFIPLAKIEGIGACGKAKAMHVKVVSVKPRE